MICPNCEKEFPAYEMTHAPGRVTEEHGWLWVCRSCKRILRESIDER